MKRTGLKYLIMLKEFHLKCCMRKKPHPFPMYVIIWKEAVFMILSGPQYSSMLPDLAFSC